MSFSAYYDPATDTIKNCKPYTYAWFHERRHQKQFRKIPKLLSLNNWVHIITYGLCSGFLLTSVLGLFEFASAVLFMGLCVIPYSAINLLLELDAFVFGTIDWFIYKRKNR